MCMKTFVIFGIIITVLLAVTVWLVQRGNTSGPSIEIVASPTGTTTEKVRFVSPQTNEVVEVTFVGKMAVLNGRGYQNLALTQTETVSGARYESVTENISVWNKGTEVTIYRGHEIIFVGIDVDRIPGDIPAPAVDSGTTSSSVSEEVASTTVPDSKISSTINATVE